MAADPRWERLGAATGIVFVFLSVIALFIGGQPGAAPDVVQYFVDNRGRLLVQSFLAGVASIFFLWFLGSVRSYLRAAEGGTGRLSAVAFAGGILTLGLLMLSLTVSTALADGMAELADPDTSRAFYALVVQTSDLTFFPVVVLTGASALVVLRTRALPSWLGWLGALVGVASLTGGTAFFVESGPFSSAGGLETVVIAAFLLWLLLTSILLVRRVS
jgi:hypothetical protein